LASRANTVAMSTSIFKSLNRCLNSLQTLVFFEISRYDKPSLCKIIALRVSMDISLRFAIIHGIKIGSLENFEFTLQVVSAS